MRNKKISAMLFIMVFAGFMLLGQLPALAAGLDACLPGLDGYCLQFKQTVESVKTDYCADLGLGTEVNTWVIRAVYKNDTPIDDPADIGSEEDHSKDWPYIDADSGLEVYKWIVGLTQDGVDANKNRCINLSALSYIWFDILNPPVETDPGGALLNITQIPAACGITAEELGLRVAYKVNVNVSPSKIDFVSMYFPAGNTAPDACGKAYFVEKDKCDDGSAALYTPGISEPWEPDRPIYDPYTGRRMVIHFGECSRIPESADCEHDIGSGWQPYAGANRIVAPWGYAKEIDGDRELAFQFTRVGPFAGCLMSVKKRDTGEPAGPVYLWGPFGFYCPNP